MQDITTFIANHPMLAVSGLIVFVLIVFMELLRTKRSGFNLTPTQAIQLINHDNASIIDIRPNDVFRKGHIIDAHSFTSSELLKSSKRLEKFRTRPLIIVCSAGIESQKIASQLLKQGYNAYSLSGGMRAWNEAQMPLVKE